MQDNKASIIYKEMNMTTNKHVIIDGKTIGCPCYIDRPLYRYDKACLVQSQAFTEQQTEHKPILRCDEIKNCPIKENYKQLTRKEKECNLLRQYKGSKQASYESMQIEWNKAVSRNKDLLGQVEKWQEIVMELETENEKLKEENFTFEQLVKEYEKYGAIEEIMQQLNQLKTENERLKNELSTYGATGICEVCKDKSVLQNDKYIKVLKDIEEVAEENIRIADSEGLTGVYRRGLAKQILQKINSCNLESNEENN